MMPRTALLVDDERLARSQLRSQLARFLEMRVVAEADSVAGAVDAVERVRPDVVFLDIQMPGSTGFDFLEQASGDFKVIFVTAYDAFAMRAFEVNALDYLLKPVRFERLSAALQRLSPPGDRPVDQRTRHALPLRIGSDDARCDAARGAPPLEYSDYLFVSSGSSARFLKIRAIKYIVAAGSYSEVYTADGRKWLLLQPIKDWEARLPAAQFVRTHRSCILNLEYVERVDALCNDTYRVFLRDQAAPLPISRRHARILKERLR
jgi:two-component system LytT family response regulator